MKSTGILMLVLTVTIGCPACSRAPFESLSPSASKSMRPEAADNAPAKVENADGLQGLDFEPEAQGKKQVQRRIKYTAKMSLIADDFDKTEKDLSGLLEKYDGILANTDVRATPGAPRIGTWTMRIPVAKFNAFCDEAKRLAELQHQSRDSEDLTAEYNDLQIYIEGRKAELENLRKIMDKTSLSDNMKNFLEVRREMKSVEDDFNRKMGRLKLLTELTDLATVTITIIERQKYDQPKPPETIERPDFGTRASKTFGDSIAALRGFGVETAILFIMIAPWLGSGLVLAVPIWLAERRRQKRKVVALQAAAAGVSPAQARE